MVIIHIDKSDVNELQGMVLYTRYTMDAKRGSGRVGPRGGTTTFNAAGMHRTVVLLDPEERRALKVGAAERGTTLSDLVRDAVRAYLGMPQRPGGAAPVPRSR
jgi:hypothetical protein